MPLRKAYAQPMTLIVFAHSPEEARESALKITQGIGGVINAVDEGPRSRTYGSRRSRRVHLNYSTADLHEIPRVVRRRA